MRKEDSNISGGETDMDLYAPVDSLVMPVVAVIDSTVRRNLMNQQGYSPYCGAERCHFTWPRTSFDGEQFKCRCGWRSAFDADFIRVYKAKWGK